MLYDPKWEKTETKADPFALEALIAWLEKQPIHETYCYMDGGECLLTKYFSDSGFKNVWLWTRVFYHGDRKIPLMNQDEAILAGVTTNLPPRFNEIAVGNRRNSGRTFGAALERARAAL